MTPAIRLQAERGQILVGDAVLPGSAVAGGGLSVAGYTVRPLTLAERDQLVALVAGTDRARQLAALVGAAACPAASGVDEVLRAAIAAVALDLAGASMPGALSGTRLLVARCVGEPAAAAMGALEADRLAAAILAALPAPAVQGGAAAPGDGWTTISYDPAPPAGHGDRVAAVRDQLAGQLLARAELPLSREVAELLLDRSELGGGDPPPAGTAAVGAGPAPHGGQASGAAAAAGSGDRWAAADTSVRPAPGTPTDRWHEAASSAAAGDDIALGAPAAHPGGSATVRHAPAAQPGGSATAQHATPQAGPEGASAGPAGTPGWPRGSHAVTTAGGSGAPPWSPGGATAPLPPPPGAAADLVPPLRPRRARPAGAPASGDARDATPHDPAPLALRLVDATGGDLAAAAVALHRAADRRGLAR